MLVVANKAEKRTAAKMLSELLKKKKKKKKKKDTEYVYKDVDKVRQSSFNNSF